jgi:hypothetical protein
MCLVGNTSNFVSSLANIAPHTNLTVILQLCVKKEEILSQNLKIRFFVKQNSGYKTKGNGTTLFPFQLYT